MSKRWRIRSHAADQVAELGRAAGVSGRSPVLVVLQRTGESLDVHAILRAVGRTALDVLGVRVAEVLRERGRLPVSHRVYDIDPRLIRIERREASLARVVGAAVELKCRRCKRTWRVPLSS